MRSVAARMTAVVARAKHGAGERCEVRRRRALDRERDARGRVGENELRRVEHRPPRRSRRRRRRRHL